MKDRHPQTVRNLAVICGLATTILSGQALAAGFQLIEQSVSGMGTAYAGGSALGEDATTVFFNPAGMTRLKGTQTSAGFHVVMPQAEFDNQGSSTANAGSGSVPLTGNGGDAGETGVVPNLYVSHQYSEELFFGLGVNVPFGLSTHYDNDWAGRYHAIKSEVETVNINPSFAYKVNDWLSLGAGVNAQYVDAKLTNAMDFGLIAEDEGLGFLGFSPTSADGRSKVQGDDWAYGYNLGLLLNLGEQTRLGAHYRSKLDYTVKGEVTFNNVPDDPFGALKAKFKDGNARSSVDLPWTLSVSLVHEFTPKWAVMADFSRTGWNDLDELRFEFDNGLPDGVTTLNWSNSNRYSVGATYKPTGQWTLRAGVAFDETPIPDKEYRTPRIPGEDRIWGALGVGYRYSDSLSFDFGYAHLWVDDPKIDKTTGSSPADEDYYRGNLKGEYDASVDIVSAQVNWIF